MSLKTQTRVSFKAYSMVARRIVAATTALLEPKPPMLVSEHSEKFRVIGAATSKMAGPWRNANAPHLKEIMDAVNEPGVHTISLMGPAQASKTEFILNVICYFMHWQPCPIEVVMPDDTLVESFVTNRLNSMIAESPELAKLINIKARRDHTNRKTEKLFPMGSIFIGSAETPKTFVQRAIRVIILDDIDQMKQDIGGQGSPDVLAAKRTETYFPKDLKIYCGNPTDDNSHIARIYRKGDRRRSRLACPFCGHKQSLQFERFKYQLHDDRSCLEGSVKYPCAGCEKEIPESYAGQMRQSITYEKARKTRGHASFWQEGGAFDVGWKPWHKIITEIEQARDKPEEFKTALNVTLARVYETTETVPPWEHLKKRGDEAKYKRGEIPKNALVLSLAVDVQHDRLEALLVGWGRRGYSYVIDHYKINDPPSLPLAWDTLRNLINEKRAAPLMCTAIDSGDGNTQKFVYDFVQSMRTGDERVIAIKGSSRYLHSYYLPPEYLEVRLDGKRNRSGSKVYSVGTDFIKNEIYAYYRLPAPDKAEPNPPGWIYFPSGFDEEFYLQATAEQKTRKKGKWYWTKKRERNEILDLLVYARAAIATRGVFSWGELDWNGAEQTRHAFIEKPRSLAEFQTGPTPRSHRDNFSGETI